MSTGVWGNCLDMEHTKSGTSSWSFSRYLCDLCPSHPAQPVLPWQRDWLLIHSPLEESLLLKHWHLFVCYLKVRLSLFKKKQEVRLSSWKQLSLYQLNHWCSPAPLTALSPFAKPACAGGALVCVALSSWPWTSHHPQPQGWEPWMGSWLLGWAPQLLVHPQTPPPGIICSLPNAKFALSYFQAGGIWSFCKCLNTRLSWIIQFTLPAPGVNSKGGQSIELWHSPRETGTIWWLIRDKSTQERRWQREHQQPSALSCPTGSSSELPWHQIWANSPLFKVTLRGTDLGTAVSWAKGEAAVPDLRRSKEKPEQPHLFLHFLLWLKEAFSSGRCTSLCITKSRVQLSASWSQRGTWDFNSKFTYEPKALWSRGVSPLVPSLPEKL